MTNKFKLILIFTLTLCLATQAGEKQIQMDNLNELSESKTPSKGTEKIVKSPDQPALFKGGSIEMHKFIKNNLKYPQEAKDNDEEGLVTYTFTVEKDGSLTNFNLIHKAHPALVAEALRIIKAMPNWNPALHKGKPVRSESYVPLYFKMKKRATSATSKH